MKAIPTTKFTNLIGMKEVDVDNQRLDYVNQQPNYVNQLSNYINQSNMETSGYAALQASEWTRNDYQQLQG